MQSGTIIFIFQLLMSARVFMLWNGHLLRRKQYVFLNNTNMNIILSQTSQHSNVVLMLCFHKYGL